MTPILASLAAPLLAAAPTVTPGTPGDIAEFAPPVEITAGEKTFVDVLYPSPVLYDLNGNGQQQLIIGDLRGYLVAAERLSADPASGWGPTASINATDGKPIKFSNW